MDKFKMRTTDEWKYRYSEGVAILRDGAPGRPTETENAIAIQQADEACFALIERGEHEAL